MDITPENIHLILEAIMDREIAELKKANAELKRFMEKQPSLHDCQSCYGTGFRWIEIKRPCEACSKEPDK